MKGIKRKRKAVNTCEVCSVEFFAESRFLSHLNSRGHRANLLPPKIIEENNDTLSFSSVDETNYVHEEQRVADPIDLETATQSETSGDEEDSLYDEQGDESDGDSENAENFFPFPSQLFFLLYCYVHNVMKPKSRSDLEFLWEIFKKGGMNVPTLNAVLNFEVEGLQNVLAPKKAYAKHHPFYWIPPSEYVKMQLAIPNIAEMITRHPEQTGGQISEMYQGQKWNDYDEFHTTSARINEQNIFVKDFVCYGTDGKLGQVKKFFNKNINNSRCLMMVVQEVVQYNGDSHCLVLTDKENTICTTEIQEEFDVGKYQLRYKSTNNILQLIDEEEMIDILAEHPSKVKSCGRPTLTLPLIIFSDETSGNTTKKWNRLETYSFSLASLPRKEIHQFSNIKFISVSNLVDSISLGKEIASDLSELENGMVMYDSLSKSEVFVQCPVICIAADNPRASEFCHHLGSSANKFCRYCDAIKATATELGQLKTDDGIKETVIQINNCRSVTSKKKLRKDTGVTEKGGQFDELDYFKRPGQTPIEILHTILLGSQKYLLAATIKTMNAEDKHKLHAKICSFDFSSFPRRIRGNITRNYGSYNGRDYKLWAQVAVFLLDGIIPNEQLNIWEMLSEIFEMAYASTVTTEDIDQLQQKVLDFLEDIKNYHPAMLSKPKLHMLLHLPNDIRLLGPASGFCSERFEAFNSVIRQQNIFSNRHAVSKDITKKFASNEKLKFVIEGGIWGENNKLQASSNIQNIYTTTRFRKFFYEEDPTTNSNKLIHQPGAMRLATYKNGHLDTFELQQVVQDTNQLSLFKECV